MDGFEGYLVEHGLISIADVEKSQRLARNSGEQLTGVIRRVTNLESGVFAEALSSYYNIIRVKTSEWPDEPVAAHRLSLSFLRAHGIFPLSQTDDGIVLATADPGNAYALKAVKLATGCPVVMKIADAAEIDAALERCARKLEKIETKTEATSSTDDNDDVQHLKDLALGTPVVHFVNKMFQDAIHSGATDIHIEPFDGHLKLRLRNDGVLRETRPPARDMGKAIVSRVKILAGLNIAERRLPQDGRVRIRIDGRQLDMRVATIPTIHGEAIAIRLLDNARRVLDLKRLGISKCDRDRLSRQIASPHGMIVVTGPTGSGKTTTLATLLSRLNEQERKILTIEDPVEYELDGINQTQAKPAIGLTFAQALRSFLRHDPDVIMVGEMRDGETAGIGIHAALTGHLVLTTLHTNTASGAIPRLLDMGVDGYLLASSLRCVVAQRLARKLCLSCRKPVNENATLPDNLQKILKTRGNGPDQLWQAVGCDRCYGSGYADRTAISEVLEINAEIAELVHRNASVSELEAAARRGGMTTMLEDGYSKCLAGETTIDEVVRIATEL